MSCNTRQNTLDKLIELQIIDDNRNVLNEKLLSTKIDIYKNTAEKKYGVFSDTPIYTIEERKQERTEKYGKLPSKIWKKLVLNIPFFDRLDIAVKEYQQREEQARQRAIEANEYINEEGDVVSRDDLNYQKLTAKEKAKTIEQLFNENPELANEVYKALGFETTSVDLTPSELTSKPIGSPLDQSEGTGIS